MNIDNKIVQQHKEVQGVRVIDRIVEVPKIVEVQRRVPRVEVREIPVERFVQRPKKEYQDIEVPVYKKEPYLVQHPVEREVQVPKTMVQQIEVVKQVPVPVPVQRAPPPPSASQPMPQPQPVMMMSQP